MTLDRDIIVNLLNNLGSRREVSMYLDAFASDRSMPPVVIKVGGAIIADHLNELASAVACLSYVGVRPVIVHGAGPQITAALAQAGIRSEFIDGHRITSRKALDVVQRVFSTVTAQLSAKIESHGVRTKCFAKSVFAAQPVEPRALGCVGTVTRVETSLIDAARISGDVSIVSPLASGDDGRIFNVNADVAARSLAVAVGATKVVFLTKQGGLRDQNQCLIPAINIADDYERLVNEPWVHSGMRLKLQEIKALLDVLPADASVAITSPDHLISELFTYRGSGTLVRRGHEIHTHNSLDTVDTSRLAALIGASFSRPLSPDYFESRRIKSVLIAGDYAAAAVLTDDGPVDYLDKFAVTREAQGLGLASSLWNRLISASPAMCWRSRTDNGINPWYIARADGMQRFDDWIVFWRGMRDPSSVTRAVRHALSMNVSFKPIVHICKEHPIAV